MDTPLLRSPGPCTAYGRPRSLDFVGSSSALGSASPRGSGRCYGLPTGLKLVRRAVLRSLCPLDLKWVIACKICCICVPNLKWKWSWSINSHNWQYSLAVLLVYLGLFLWLLSPVASLPETCVASGRTLFCHGSEVPPASERYTKIRLATSWELSGKEVQERFKNVKVNLISWNESQNWISRCLTVELIWMASLMFLLNYQMRFHDGTDQFVLFLDLARILHHVRHEVRPAGCYALPLCLSSERYLCF